MPHSFTPRPGLDLKRACRDRGCTLQDLVNDALEAFLAAKDITQDTSNPTETRSDSANVISIGKVRRSEASSPVKKPTITVILEEDGTQHQLKEGKIVACKKPSQNWRYFIEE